ncbi:MAG: efflux RND transporter periplasmic adaptor subunit [Bacteroidota bacterium]
MKYFLGLCLMIGLWSCSQEASVEVAPVRPVKHMTITTGKGAEMATFTGLTKSNQETRLSFKVSGVLQSLSVKDGQRVRQGQLIASIDPEDYNLQVEQADVQVKQAMTSLNVARSTYERIERLYENNSVSLSEFEQAKGNYEASQAQLQAAQKQLQAAKNQASDTKLRAPYTGIISSLGVEKGELVAAGNPIGLLSTEGKPEVSFGVAASYVGKLKPRQKVEIILSIVPDQVFEGEVTEVAFSQGNAATYPVIARFLKTDERIRPGLSAEVRLPLSVAASQDAYFVPAKVVRENGQGQRFVYKLVGPGDTLTVKQQVVEIGDLSAQGFVVKNGLQEGDRIATAGLNALLDGMKVRLLK